MKDKENNRRVLAEGKFVRLVARGRWEWVERTNTSGAVVIVAVTSDRRLVLIEEYRQPLARVVELPAGLVGDEPGAKEEDLIEAAKRELLEETGCVSENWMHLIEGPASPGLTSERYTLFLALDTKIVSAGGGDDSEDIHVRLVPLDQVETLLLERCQAGLLVDPKVYLGLYFAKKHITDNVEINQ